MKLDNVTEDELWLSFWHWFSIYGGDTGQVEIRTLGGDWEPFSAVFDATSGGWVNQIIDLSSYIGQTVQIAFHFDDDGAYSSSYPYPPLISSGWYVDEVAVVEGPQNIQ